MTVSVPVTDSHTDSDTVSLSVTDTVALIQGGAVSPVVGRTLCTPAARVRVPG